MSFALLYSINTDENSLYKMTSENILLHIYTSGTVVHTGQTQYIFVLVGLMSTKSTDFGHHNAWNLSKPILVESDILVISINPYYGSDEFLIHVYSFNN